MTRRRFIQDRETLQFHEVPNDYAPDVGRCDSALWGDRQYAGMCATDGTPIDTRSKHREYMRRNGLTTCDDYTQEWKARAVERERAMQGHDPTRKADIARAIAVLEARGRK